MKNYVEIPKKYTEKYKILLKKHYQFMALGMFLFIFILIYFSKSESTSEARIPSADTYIPAGYVLVPIDVVNREALESLLGAWGVVDLYIPSVESNKLGRKVASRVKILRAPLKPDEFAVLVREADASQLVHQDNGYFVVIQNPAQNGMHLVKPVIKRSRITYEDG